MLMCAAFSYFDSCRICHIKNIISYFFHGLSETVGMQYYNFVGLNQFNVIKTTSPYYGVLYTDSTVCS